MTFRSVEWVHPSWRDLVISELEHNQDERRHFLERCSWRGLSLALSVAGGAQGDRAFPLLVHDGDWKLLSERAVQLVTERRPYAAMNVLGSLQAAFNATPPRRSDVEAERLAALTRTVLTACRAAWEAGHASIELIELKAYYSTC
jgi:hypothetical protein